MIKYLTTFNDETEYNEFLSSLDCPYINVSYISQTGENKYYKESSALQLQPFTIHVDELPDGQTMTFSFRGPQRSITDETLWQTRTYIRYKKNNDDWKTINYDLSFWRDLNFDEISMQEGDTVQIINKMNAIDDLFYNFYDNGGYGAKLTISGNVMSLIGGDDYVYWPANKVPFPSEFNKDWTNVYEGVMYPRFNHWRDVFTDAGDLWLPTKNLCPNIFKEMFYDCHNLEVAPDVNAKYLPYHACDNMFYGCSSLHEMPNVLAETVERGSMYRMFALCTTMNTVTDLHIKHIVGNNGDGALGETFMGCYAITSCPDWDASIDIVLPENCYYGEDHFSDGGGYAWLMSGMFMGCVSLQTCDWKITLESSWHNGDSSVWQYMFGGLWDDGLQIFRKCNALTTLPILEFKKLNWPDLPIKYPSAICGENGSEKDQNLITSCTVLGVDTQITNDSTMYGFAPTGTFYLSSTSQYLPGGEYENDYPCGLGDWTKAVYVDPNA